MNRHSARFWLWTALSAVAWITTGFLIALRWQNGTAAFCGPFSSDGAAAWVQALGSIVAIGVAVYVPYKLASDERNTREADRRLRSRMMAAKLLVPTANLEHEAKKVVARLSPRPAKADASAPIYWDSGLAHRLDDIETIKREWGELSLMTGGLPDKFAILITVADAFNRRFDTLNEERNMHYSKLRWERDTPHLIALAENIAELAKLTYAAARQESLLALPDAMNLPSPTEGFKG